MTEGNFHYHVNFTFTAMFNFTASDVDTSPFYPHFCSAMLAGNYWNYHK